MTPSTQQAGVRPLALVTGASAGIGAAFARLYARRGCDVVLTARRLDRLEGLAAELQAMGVRAHVIVADLALRDAVDGIAAELARRGLSPDILVNNAGYGFPGLWRSTRFEDQAAFLQVMLLAPLELSHRLLPAMIERKFGRILNIASVAGYVPGAIGHTLYPAVKSALIRFSQSLHVEQAGSGVHVTAVCPGYTLSEFHDVNGTRTAMRALPGFLWQTADAVAVQACQANERGKPVVVTGVANKAMVAVLRLAPESWLTAAVASRQRRK